MTWENIAVGTEAGREPAYGGYHKVFKQQSSKSELLEFHYCGVCLWLKGAQVVKQGRMPGVTGWSEDSLGCRRNGWCQGAVLFPARGVGMLAESSRAWFWLPAVLL